MTSDFRRWYDVTTVASDYDVEFYPVTSETRWRPRTFPQSSGGVAVMEWRYGEPPTRAHLDNSKPLRFIAQKHNRSSNVSHGTH